MITVTVLSEASEDVLHDLNYLMEELRKDQSPLRQASLSELKGILANKNIAVVVAKHGKRIVGVATLYVIQKIGKRVAAAEDVVVHSDYRGQGLGEKIIRKLIAVARARKAQSIGLTARPSRIAGNKLYQKMGFVQKETNVYRLKL